MEKNQQRFLRGLLIGFLILSSGMTFGLQFLLVKLQPAELSIVLTNIATVGGIASGLSLAGYTNALSSTKSMKIFMSSYGTSIRWILLGGYSVMVAACLAAAIAAGFSESYYAVLVCAASASVILLGLVTTALLINSMFGWMRAEEYL